MFKGIQEAVHKSINKCEWEMSLCQMCPNIVLCGGTSMLPGLADRMKKEITSLVNPSNLYKINNINIITTPHRIDAAWIGGSIFGSLAFQFPQNPCSSPQNSFQRLGIAVYEL